MMAHCYLVHARESLRCKSIVSLIIVLYYSVNLHRHNGERQGVHTSNLKLAQSHLSSMETQLHHLDPSVIFYFTLN